MKHTNNFETFFLSFLTWLAKAFYYMMGIKKK